MAAIEIMVNLDEALYRRVSELAKASGQSTAELVAELLERHSQIVAEIEEGLREADAGEFATDEEVEAAFRRLDK